MIDRHQVDHIAHLARIEVPPERLDALTQQMASIVGYVDQLRALEVGDVPPLTHAGAATNVFREDVPREPLAAEDALRVAPDREGSFYRVPKVIGEA